ncbi:MAG: dihydropteroate synthase [Oscillospiraceae bacterium]|jgi:5-methyltetrahydrofolate--homocysteine methyltransferase|nr:dihydropteroate synthase [Oscillospiraceae bacterium]
MIIIGEKINSTLKAVRPAIAKRDAEAIQSLAKRQADAGAAFIDVNAGMFHDAEPETIAWLVETVQAATDKPFSIDSPNPAAIAAALAVNKNGAPIINSITDEKARYDAILPLALEYKAKVIALCMDDTGMPEDADGRFTIAARLIDKLTKAGVALSDIFIDPLVRPVSTGSHYGKAAIDTIRRVKTEYPDVHIACGLSNVSFGLPARKLINQTFLVAAMAAGMDGAILDPLDTKLTSLIWASEALLGLDEYCLEYLDKYREGLIEV